MADSTIVTEPVVVTDAPAAAASATRSAGKNYGKTAKVGALWAVGREWVTQLLGIPTALLLARLLSPADFGIAAAATFFIQLGKKLGNMGLNTALVRMKDVREEHRASVFVINLVFCLTAWTVLMFSAPSIANLYEDQRVAGAVRVAATIFLVNFFGAVEYAVLQRDMKFKEMAFIEWITPLCFMPIAVGMAFAGYGYWSLLVGHVVANMASTFGKVYYGGWRPSLRVTRRGLAETVPFGMGVYAKRLLGYAAENLDSFMVGSLLGVTSLGFYDKAFNTTDNLANRLSLGGNVVFRIFAIIQDQRDRFVKAYAKVVIAGTIVTLPVFAGLIVSAHEFIIVAFGTKWLPAVVPFQLLCAAGALRQLSGNSSAVVQASGQIWGEVWRRVIYVIMLGVLLFSFRTWGITGAAAGVLLSNLVNVLLMQALVAKILSLSWGELTTPLVPGVVCALGTAAVTAAAKAAVLAAFPDTPDWILLGVQTVAGGIFWVLFALFGKFRSLQDVVSEVLEDVVPGPIRKVIKRFR